MTDRIDLPRRYRDSIEVIWRRHLPHVEIWAYGSRIKGRSHVGSDLDLVLRSPTLEQIPIKSLNDLVKSLDQSNIPTLVQVLDWARLPENFQREIEHDYVVLMKGD